MFNRLIAWSLNNRLLVLAGTLVLFIAGAYTLKQMAKIGRASCRERV